MKPCNDHLPVSSHRRLQLDVYQKGPQHPRVFQHHLDLVSETEVILKGVQKRPTTL